MVGLGQFGGLGSMGGYNPYMGGGFNPYQQQRMPFMGGGFNPYQQQRMPFMGGGFNPYMGGGFNPYQQQPDPQAPPSISDLYGSLDEEQKNAFLQQYGLGALPATPDSQPAFVEAPPAPFDPPASFDPGPGMPDGPIMGTMGGPGYGEYPLGTAGPRVDPGDPNYIPPPSDGGRAKLTDDELFSLGQKYDPDPGLNSLYNSLSRTIAEGAGFRALTPEEAAQQGKRIKDLEQQIIGAGGQPYKYFTNLPHGGFRGEGPDPSRNYDPMTGRYTDPEGQALVDPYFDPMTGRNKVGTKKSSGQVGIGDFERQQQLQRRLAELRGRLANIPPPPGGDRANLPPDSGGGNYGYPDPSGGGKDLAASGLFGGGWLVGDTGVSVDTKDARDMPLTTYDRYDPATDTYYGYTRNWAWGDGSKQPISMQGSEASQDFKDAWETYGGAQQPQRTPASPGGYSGQGGQPPARAPRPPRTLPSDKSSGQVGIGDFERQQQLQRRLAELGGRLANIPPPPSPQFDPSQLREQIGGLQGQLGGLDKIGRMPSREKFEQISQNTVPSTPPRGIRGMPRLISKPVQGVLDKLSRQTGLPITSPYPTQPRPVMQSPTPSRPPHGIRGIPRADIRRMGGL